MNEKVIQMLNNILLLEAEAAHLYKGMQYYAQKYNYKPLEKFFNEQFLEEYSHFDIVAAYLIDREANVKIPMLNAVEIGVFTDCITTLTKALEHEKLVQTGYQTLYKISIENNDPTTAHLAMDFLEEQVEEIKTIKDMLVILQNEHLGLDYLLRSLASNKI